MGDTANISVELQSLLTAVAALDTSVIPRIDTLSTNFQHYLQSLKAEEWTTEDVATEYAGVYLQAIGAYDQVIQGIKKDIHHYRDELQGAHDDYKTRDDSVMDEMNRRLAKLDDSFQSDTMGGIAYGQRSALGNGSTPGVRPDDTSPETPDGAS